MWFTVLDKSESKFNINEHLDYEKKQQLSKLLDKYSDVFLDEPGKTNLVTHELTTDILIHHEPFTLFLITW